MHQRRLHDEIGQIMRERSVIAFATYWEYVNAMHVNQPFTDVAVGARDGRGF